MKNLYLTLMLLILAVPSVAHAQVSVIDNGETVIYDLSGPDADLLSESYFDDYLKNNGFNALYQGASLSFDGPGTLTFELIGSKPDEYNTKRWFLVNGRRQKNSGGFRQTNFVTNGVNGAQLPIVYEVNAPTNRSQRRLQPGQTPNLANDIYFVVRESPRDANGNRLPQINTRHSFFSQQFAVYVPDAQTTTGLDTVILALEDGQGSLDFDDLVIRATFTPTDVPEPGILVILIAGLLLIGYRQRHTRTARQAV